MTAHELKIHLGKRLQQARKLRGLSLRQLAEKIGGLVSYAALQKYEKGLTGPGSEVLNALCQALAIDPDYLFRETTVELAGIEFRKKTSVKVTEVDRIREESRDFFERYLEIEAILKLKSKPLKPFPLDCPEDAAGDSFDEALESVEEIARKVRRAWKLGENPIANLHEELEHAGVKVKEVDAGKNFDGFSGWAGEVPVIVLARHLNENLPRKRFTAAHELAHLALQLPEGLPKKLKERLCDRFAGSFLLPASGLGEFGEKRSQITLGELKALKEDWGLSLQAIMRRFEDLGIIPSHRRKSFDYRYRSHFKWHLTGEPGHWNGEEESSRFRQLVLRACAEELITRSKAAHLLGLNHRDLDQAMTFIA